MIRITFLVLGSLALGACTTALPPAVPDEPTVFAPPPAPPPVQEAARAVAAAPPAVSADDGPASDALASAAALSDWATVAPSRPPGKPERPVSVITAANSGSQVTPSRRGYAEGQSSVQRYPYLPGKLYAIYTSPEHPTTILLPPGERLAAPPTLNPAAWDVGLAEMGSEGQPQDALIVRPLAPGQEATTPLLTQSGRTFFCRLRSLERTSMVAVTWDIPRLPVPQGAQPPTHAAKTESAEGMAHAGPLVDLTRLHTAYTVEMIQGKPPWVPLAVYDDGRTTFIRFREPLGYTTAPAVFVRHADGTPGVVEFTPYTVPGAPEKGAYYLVQGLWPQLELRGSDGQRVRLTRVTGQPTPYQAVSGGQ